MGKIKAIFRVFLVGHAVANPASWKKGQITAGVLATLLSAIFGLVKTFGYDVVLSDEQILQIGGAIVSIYGLFNVGVTVASTDKVGLSFGGEGAISVPEVQSKVPEVAKEPKPKVSNVRKAANGEILDGSEKNLA